jgi:hypothetical protein
MSQLFARVELLGNPSEEVYENRHKMMGGLHWCRRINDKVLHHATYQAINAADAPDLMSLATDLKPKLEKNIWTKSLVLVIRSADWAKSVAS